MKSFGLGKMTLRSAFRKPETRMYPGVAVPEVEGRRGQVSVSIENCIFCGMCVRCCPADAISVSRDEKTWSIAAYSCVQCGSCVDGCPKSCLSMKETLPVVVVRKAVVTETAPEQDNEMA